MPEFNITNEMVEAGARAIIRSNGGNWVDVGDEWKHDVGRYYEMCAKFPNYGGTDIANAFRQSRAAIAAALAEGLPQ